MTYTLHHGDALDVLRALEPGAADVLICDPPSAIGFMGQHWDSDRGGREQWVAWLASILAEAYRILPPGACGLVWALPRTSHWTATACEDAGFKIVDRIAHISGQGFPKHKHALKPAVEDWWLIQKPGAARRINVDECRVGWQPSDLDPKQNRSITPHAGLSRAEYESDGEFLDGVSVKREPYVDRMSPAGRWPAHLVLSHSPTCNGVCADDCPIKVLGEQSGERASGEHTGGYNRTHSGVAVHHSKTSTFVREASTGTAARYFTNLPADDAPPFIYAAKASRRERNAGCEGLEAKQAEHYNQFRSEWRADPRSANGGYENNQVGPRANHHPTVKSQALMRWLVRLITPPGGTVLDCFAGSGSTGVAALLEGRSFVGIEQDAAYVAIAEARLAHALGPLFSEAL